MKLFHTIDVRRIKMFIDTHVHLNADQYDEDLQDSY